jgi:hypothetical protein
MNYGELMDLNLDLDTWKQCFNSILEIGNLESTKGYKFIVKNNICYLDPPSHTQSITRWYNGYNKEQFYNFLNDNKTKFFDYLSFINKTNVLKTNRPHIKSFTINLVTFLMNLAKCFSLCRSIYPEYTELNYLLLSYYHIIKEWIGNNGVITNI